MNKIIFDADTMKIISLFQSMTSAGVKDCIQNDDELIFIVNEGDIGKAIGKNAVNIKRLSYLMKRKIKIVEYSSDLKSFVANFIMPFKAEISEEEGTITLKTTDSRAKGILIGRGGQNLRQLENNIKRHFQIKEIRVE